MSRRYILPAARRNPAARQTPYQVVQDNDDGKCAGNHAADQQHLTGVRETSLRRASLCPAAPPRPKQSELTQEAFDKLLALLDRDRDVAGQKYETIHCKLQKFFECRGCPNPDDLADETINIVARKIDQGQQITGDEPARYFHGVARNVIRDYWRRSPRLLESTECLLQSYHPSQDPTETADPRFEGDMSERRLEELERCLRALTDENRELIIKYYEYEGTAKKAGRRTLAHRMGIQSNALRLRVHRIRLKLKHDFDDTVQ